MELPDRWIELSRNEAESLHAELQRELSSAHQLHDAQVSAIARFEGDDDVLFSVSGCSSRLAVIHLTWHEESSPAFPSVIWFSDEDDFRGNWTRILE